MRSALLGFAFGVCILQWQGYLPPMWLSVCLGIVSVAVMFALRLKIRRAKVANILTRSAVPAYLVLGIALGFSWASYSADRYLSKELPHALEGQDLRVVGTIDVLPFRFPQGVRFNFAVESATDLEGHPVNIPDKLALSWYTRNQKGGDAVGEVHPGERWQLQVRLQKPHATANPMGFDYEVWLLEQGLRATGTVREDADGEWSNQRVTEFVYSINNVVEASRDVLRTRILDALPGARYAGVIVALVIGDQRQVSQSDWKVFNRTGIGHLISISGLHITMIAGMFAKFIAALWRRSFFTRAQLPLLLPVQKVAALTGVSVALLYVLLAGFGVPAQRTFYMIAVVAWAVWTGRLTSVSYIMCIALGVVLVLDPWAVVWPGFWLSFGAVGTILFASVGRTPHPKVDGTWKQRLRARLREETHTQYVVTLGLVPLSALLFGQVSIVSPIANAIAIPLVSLGVAPLALAGSVLPAPVSHWVLGFSHWLIQILADLLEYLSGLPFAVWNAPIPELWIFFAALIGTLWLLTPRGWPLRWLGMLCWLPLLLNSPSHPRHGEFWVEALDVGQGMGLVIETEHARLLYDTGPAYSPESDGGNRVILPYLHARGIDHLDGIIVSHNDADHSGGALSVIAEMPISWSMTSLAMDSRIVQQAPHHMRCVAGLQWDWDGVHFEILQPQPSSYLSTKYKPNARSCTLKISGPKHSMILAGDIEAVQEDELVNSIPQTLKADILLAPHHGSGTSSTLPFLQAVHPQYAIFQLGYRNRYHHPKAEVYQRYGDLGITRLRSDDEGEIELHVADEIEVSSYRRWHLRYWYGR